MKPHQFSLALSGLCALVELMGTPFSAQAQNDSWTVKGEMLTPRAAFCASVVNDILYVIGGDSGQAISNQVEAYDASTGTWTNLTPMPTVRVVFSCGVVDGKIYAIGGQEGLGAPDLATVEVYDPVADSWTTAAPMPTARRVLSACSWDGKIYVVGGLAGAGTTGQLATVEVYDPVTDNWTQAASMPTARWGLSLAVANDLIYAIGGVTDHPIVVGTVEVYDPMTDDWAEVASLPVGKVAFAATELNGRIYVIGGSLDSFPYGFVSSTVEEYDPASDTWTSRASLNIGRSFLGAGAVNGKIYAFGGLTVDIISGLIAPEIEEYTPLITGVEAGPAEGLMTFALHQNYPNPFNPMTKLSYFLPQSGSVELKIYDILGKEVQTVVNQFQSAGSYSLDFNADNLPSGLYIYKLQAGNHVAVKKMLLLR